MTDDIEFYETFFQKSKSYYVEKWTKYKAGQKFTFNVFAFLFGLFWFMYRKMYLEAIVILMVIISETFLEDLILPNHIEQETRELISFIITIASAIIIGFLGNYFYVRRADRIVQVAKAKYTNNEEQKIFLNKKGGISFFFVFVIILLAVLIVAYNNYVPATV